MPSAAYFAEKAAMCRELIRRHARDREVAEQLQLWADEFEIMAQALSARMRPIGHSHTVRQPVEDRDTPDVIGDKPQS